MPDQTVWAETLIASQADVGSMLRAARESLGVSLETVSQDLRIRIPYLRAIEEARFADLPGPAYAIAFLRSYAGYVGFSAEDIIAAYRRHDGVEPQAPALRFPVIESERRLPRGVMVALSILLLAGAYVVWNVIGRQDVAPAPPVAELPSRLQPPPAAAASAAVPPASEAAAAVTADPGTKATEAAAPRPAASASAATAAPTEARNGDPAAVPTRQPPLAAASAATPPAAPPPAAATPSATAAAAQGAPARVAPSSPSAAAPAAATPAPAAPAAAPPAPQAATAAAPARGPVPTAAPAPQPVAPPATAAAPSSGPPGERQPAPPAAAPAPPATAAAPPATPTPAVQPAQARERTIKVSRPMILELRDQTGKEVLATVNLRPGESYVVPSYIAYRLLPDS